MTQAHDLLQCPVCGEWYLPKITNNDPMTAIHCLDPDLGVVDPSFPDMGKIVDLEV